ncbi:hypothetical protein C8A05DRAFT_42263 [Staphylotrichum tortipilum]|uniref:FAD/NAD(P)-binding domain-containing protein n=1 Tax=Staphylotrichum tortipilum TaxID=2831512 RepID=A0AAN6RVN1_9PEZI|nr:hypothetical protein C8A05DRAFT_42263 [Staphylotrichum longicolle]
MGSIPEPQPALRVIIVGGSYGGLSAALNLQDLCHGLPPRDSPPAVGTEFVPGPQFPIDITIVDERDGFYHLIGSPLALASETFAQKFWIKYSDMPALQSPDIHVLQGSVTSVDPARKIAIYTPHGNNTVPAELAYDYFIAAAGLRRPWPVVPQSLRKKEFLLKTGEHTRSSTAAKHGVVIVGGGAVGVEMAAELKHTHPSLPVTLVHSHSKLLSSEPLPDEVKDTALELLRETDVTVLMNHRLERSEEEVDGEGGKCVRVWFANGESLRAGRVDLAVSRGRPATGFLPAEVLDGEGYVKIKADLSFAPDHFAVGDLAKWSGIKRCGAAMHMGYYAVHNIHQLMAVRERAATAGKEEKEPKFLELGEIPPMIGLAVGKKAVAYWPERGVSSGEEVLSAFFGEDLGFSICWNHMRLGTAPEGKVE